MTDWKQIEVDPRHTARRMKVAIRGSIIKVLTELITNSDDSYFRLEKNGKNTSGLIQIGLLSKKRKGKKTAEFFIRDFAEGIAADTLENKFGKYGAETAGGTRRGYFGQGAKDALCTMDDSKIVSKKDGKISACRLTMDADVPQYLIEDFAASKRLLESINSRLDIFSPKKCNDNCTIVSFKLPDNQRVPKFDSLVKSIQSFYMLRKIFSDSKRKVQLINIRTKKIIDLKFDDIPGIVMDSGNFTIKDKLNTFDIEYFIVNAGSDLNQTASDTRTGGLLIVDEDDAVLDLTLFGYDEDASAAPITGEVCVKGFKRLFLKDDSVLTETRDGLDNRHSFSRKLRTEMRKKVKIVIDKLVEEKKKKGISVEKQVDKQIRTAFAKINSLMKKEAEIDFEGNEDQDEPDPIPKNGLMFYPKFVHINQNQIKTVNLLIDTSKIPSGSEISIECTNHNIDVNPIGVIVVPETFEEENLIKIGVNIYGETIGEKGVITASHGSITAELFVTIVELFDAIPPTGFDFVPDKVRVYEGKTTILKLLIDTTKVHAGSLVTINSDSKNVLIKSIRSGTQEIDGTMFAIPHSSRMGIITILVSVEGKKAGKKAYITANANNNEARALVKVIEKKPKGGFFRDYRLDQEKDGRQRFSFDKTAGIIYVHVKAPVLQKYLGPAVMYLNDKHPEAMAILAEVILTCICRQWARYRFDNGFRDYINYGDPAAMREEEESEARKIDYSYGKQIHEWISGKYSEE